MPDRVGGLRTLYISQKKQKNSRRYLSLRLFFYLFISVSTSSIICSVSGLSSGDVKFFKNNFAVLRFWRIFAAGLIFSIIMTQSEKIAKYEEIVPQIEALVSGVAYGISSLANIAAVIHRNMNFFWTGFYVVDGDFLLLGPFQGDAACIRIPKGKGVCGSAWAQGNTIGVKDVEEFP